MTYYNHLDDDDDLEAVFELYVNQDCPDIEHIVIDDPDTNTNQVCIKVTSLDLSGDPVHSIFNLESLTYLVKGLTTARQSLLKTITPLEDLCED